MAQQVKGWGRIANLQCTPMCAYFEGHPTGVQWDFLIGLLQTFKKVVKASILESNDLEHVFSH